MHDSRRRIHSRFNRIMAIIVWTAAALFVVLMIVDGDLRSLWIYPLAVLAAFLGWAALWRPGVGVSDAGVTVQNVTHRVDIPWVALIHVDTRHALTLFTPGRRFVAWSAPAPGFVASAITGRAEANRERRAVGGTPRVGDLLGTDSGDAAMLVREAWQRRRDDGLIEAGAADDAPVARHWDVVTIGTTAVLLALTVGALILT